jgi:hypothetical protein
MTLLAGHFTLSNTRRVSMRGGDIRVCLRRWSWQRHRCGRCSGSCARTRNARLAAIHSFMRYEITAAAAA